MKTFEQFENDNNKIWIVGIPSGEALYVKRDIFDDIYSAGLLKYNTKYVDTGFYTFEDENIDKIQRMLSWSTEDEPTGPDPNSRDYNILPHHFGDSIRNIVSATDHIKAFIYVYVIRDVIKLMAGRYRIEINAFDTGSYNLSVFESNVMIEKYYVPNLSGLIQCVKKEADKYLLNLETNPKSGKKNY